MTAAATRQLISSVDVANTVLKEHYRLRHTPTVVALLAQVHAVERAHDETYGTTITGDEYTDRGDGFGPTTETLRAKFHDAHPRDLVGQYIPVASGDVYVLPQWRVRRLVHRVLKASL